nr:GtrA family protein [uncultured Desulfobacter sp.]
MGNKTIGLFGSAKRIKLGIHRHHTASQFFKFAMIGCVGFVVDAGVMLLLDPLSGLNPMQARPISFLFAVTATWYLNRRFTFGCRTKCMRLQEWIRYTSANGIGAVLNLIIFYTLMGLSSLFMDYPVFALAIASVLALMFNFWASKTLAFRIRKN